MQLIGAATPDVPNQTPMPQPSKQLLNACPVPPMDIIVTLLAGCQSAILSSNEWHNDMNPAFISAIMAPNFKPVGHGSKKMPGALTFPPRGPFGGGGGGVLERRGEEGRRERGRGSRGERVPPSCRNAAYVPHQPIQQTFVIMFEDRQCNSTFWVHKLCPHQNTTGHHKQETRQNAHCHRILRQRSIRVGLT